MGSDSDSDREIISSVEEVNNSNTMKGNAEALSQDSSEALTADINEGGTCRGC